jgi:hypothetical protein
MKSRNAEGGTLGRPLAKPLASVLGQQSAEGTSGGGLIAGSILLESAFFILMEDGSLILLEQ